MRSTAIHLMCSKLLSTASNNTTKHRIGKKNIARWCVEVPARKSACDGWIKMNPFAQYTIYVSLFPSSVLCVCVWCIYVTPNIFDCLIYVVGVGVGVNVHLFTASVRRCFARLYWIFDVSSSSSFACGATPTAHYYRKVSCAWRARQVNIVIMVIYRRLFICLFITRQHPSTHSKFDSVHRLCLCFFLLLHFCNFTVSQ